MTKQREPGVGSGMHRRFVCRNWTLEVRASSPGDHSGVLGGKEGAAAIAVQELLSKLSKLLFDQGVSSSTATLFVLLLCFFSSW